MSEIKVNKISPKQLCTQLTLGDSGDTIIIPANTTTSIAGTLSVTGTLSSDTLKNANLSTLITQTNTTTITIGTTGQTVTLASGATQSGFGRTGTVNWDTTAKTTTVTAVSGSGYFVNTTSGAITVNLPSAVAGDIVAISDYANTAATNNITITPNGSQKIQSQNISYKINVNGGTATLVYVDSTQGWRPTDAATATSIIEPPLFTTATGGTITTSGDYKIHTFTGPGTFEVTQLGNSPTVPTGGPNTVSYLIVAGGGGGNGGGGGFREGRDITPSYTASPLVAPTGLTISKTSYPITVGAGGNAPGPNASPGVASSGSPSIFSTITSAGGGVGGGGPGGSGGGMNNGTAGTGNSPPVSPPQGNPGGPNVNGQSSSGGGGATEAGAPNNGPNNPGGRGGAGATTSIIGSPTAYAGGGGGGANVALGHSGGAGSPCGTGGKGVGAPPTSTSIPSVAPNAAGNGTTNRGGGGGGAGYGCGNGAGGSGVVVIRYKFQ